MGYLTRHLHSAIHARMSPQLTVAFQYTVILGVILWLGSRIKVSRPKDRPYYRDHTYDGKPMDRK